MHDRPQLREFARDAFESGLAVTRPDGTRVPIGIAATPVVLDRAEVRRRARHARLLSAATLRTARWRLSWPEAAGHVHAALSPAESRLVAATGAALDRLAVTRVDYLANRALEVNATIPAMQGYSDIAVEAWLQLQGVDDVARWRDANGSNAAALLDALSAQFAELKPDTPLRTIALLCRRGDAQLTELRYLAQRFREAGIDARVAHPDEPLDAQLVYRHLFVHRLDLEPAPRFEAMLAHWRNAVVLNPPAPQVEMKSTLAILSEASIDDAYSARIGLTDDEREAVVASVPWTRELVPARVDEVIAEPDRFVLKRAWSYGGHDVFVGRARESDEFARRVAKTYPAVRDWSGLVHRAATDPRRYVVQEAVEVTRERLTLCLPGSITDVEATVDYSAYASVGPAGEGFGWSGVCRAAASDVVNIVGGGAVVPLVTREVYDAVVADAGGDSPRSPPTSPCRSA